LPDVPFRLRDTCPAERLDQPAAADRIPLPLVTTRFRVVQRGRPTTCHSQATRLHRPTRDLEQIAELLHSAVLSDADFGDPTLVDELRYQQHSTAELVCQFVGLVRAAGKPQRVEPLTCLSAGRARTAIERVNLTKLGTRLSFIAET
jgi:hypothetical protein